MTNWGTNPLTRGAYSGALPGMAHMREVVAEPVGDLVFFAGEATGGPLAQTAGGAMNSGHRAAAEIYSALRNSTLMSPCPNGLQLCFR
ncbi:FAD-dependent oxidoreductase [Skermanella rosea]|uniref:FAD-dependent oxidoreductase n=1 Tax=Skermanella rosea TaxID=1817965 RepID=UPI001934485C|nr:FAD-dependent oxidoreductase [Skermanella rosea]